VTLPETRRQSAETPPLSPFPCFRVKVWVNGLQTSLHVGVARRVSDLRNGRTCGSASHGLCATALVCNE